MSSTDFSTEVERMSLTLAQSREKLIDQWSGEELSRLTQDILQAEHKILQFQLLEKKNHKEQLSELKYKINVNKKALQDYKCEVSELVSQVELLNTVAEDRLEEKKSVDTNVAQLTEHIITLKKVILDHAKDVSTKLVRLQETSNMFKRGLGLVFKKTSGGRLQVVYTNIDAKDPEARCYFYVKIMEGKYIVSDCEPAVENFDILVEKLNATNNFRAFVIAIRKSFTVSMR